MPTGDRNRDIELLTSILDTFVHAPLGLLLGGPAEPDELVRNGRTQIANARAIGQLVLKAYCRGQVEGETEPGTVAGIVDYDSLTVRHILPRLSGLDPRRLAAVRAHEVANRNRTTVLARIDRLLASSRPASDPG